MSPGDHVKRKLTPAEIAAQQRGSTRLGPGVWVDRDGGIHFSVPELLAHVDVEDTPENRRLIEAQIRDVILGANPDAVIVEQE